MGEVEGEGILRDGGVCGIVLGEEELAESDDVADDATDETDNERDLLCMLMGMGSELVLANFSSEDI